MKVTGNVSLKFPKAICDERMEQFFIKINQILRIYGCNQFFSKCNFCENSYKKVKVRAIIASALLLNIYSFSFVYFCEPYMIFQRKLILTNHHQ